MSGSRRMLMAGGGSAPPSPFAVVSEANARLCRIEERMFRKAYDGEAFAAICFIMDGGKYWQFPALIARTEGACRRDPLVNATVFQTTVNGETWYYSGSEYAKNHPPDNAFRHVGENPAALPIIYNPLSENGVFPGGDAEAHKTAEILVKIHLGILNAEVLIWEE